MPTTSTSSRPGTLEERRGRNLRNEVLGLAAVRLRRQLERSLEGDPAVQELLERVVRREVDPASAAEELLRGRDERLVPGRVLDAPSIRVSRGISPSASTTAVRTPPRTITVSGLVASASGPATRNPTGSRISEPIQS